MLRWPEKDPMTGKRKGRYHFLVRKEDETIDVETAKASALVWSRKQGQGKNDLSVCQSESTRTSSALRLLCSRLPSTTYCTPEPIEIIDDVCYLP
jgi:hypothetical protein